MISKLLPYVLILIAIALFFGYVSPTYSGQIATTKQSIASYDSALVAANAFTTKENQLIAERNAIPDADIGRLQIFLPDSVDNIQLIVDMNALASRTGITLSNFSIQGGSPVHSSSASSTPVTVPDPNSGLAPTSLTSSLAFSVNVTGSYAAFQSFLMATEQSLRPMDVTNMSVSSSATGVYTYNVTFQIYWLN